MVDGKGERIRLTRGLGSVLANPDWWMVALTLGALMFLGIQIRDARVDADEEFRHLRTSIEGETCQSLIDQMSVLNYVFF